MTTTNWIAPGRVSQDDTTRYLCAAAHLDSQYADAAIREFVVEPTRPIPPSPGLHPASVLVEAIAARTRRKLRDGALIVLTGLTVWLAWGSPLLYGWIALAVVLSLASAFSGGRRPNARNIGAYVLAAVVVVVVLLLTTGALDGLLSDMGLSSSSSSSSYGDYYGSYDSSYDADVLWPYALIPLAFAFVVVIVDRLHVWTLLRTRFGTGARTRPPSDPFDQQREILRLSPPAFLRHLERYRTAAPHPAGGAPLVVHRGYHPFVGSGLHRDSWSMALPLEKLPDESKSDGSPFDELTTNFLYDRVRAEIAVLQESTALSPDRRLRELKIEEAIYASSDELVDHLHDPVSRLYLSNVDYPPHPSLPPEEVSALRGQPREWSRYYLCFRVETWDRDLVLSSFLHAAVDASTLYLEWTPCMLPPIRDSYREIDKLTSNPAGPIGHALLDAMKLPVSVFPRALHTLTLIRPRRRERGVLDPDAYGSLSTLREMASSSGVASYFQLVDVERYEKILHSRLIPAISRILRDCGYSPASFERQASLVINRAVTIHGDNYGAFAVDSTVTGDMSGAGVNTPERSTP